MAQAMMMPSTAMMEAYQQNSLLTRPEGRRLTQLEQEMANVLARTDISEREKMELFDAVLQTFMKVRTDIINNGLMMTNTTGPQLQPEPNLSEQFLSKLQGILQDSDSSNQQASADIKPKAEKKKIKASKKVIGSKVHKARAAPSRIPKKTSGTQAAIKHLPSTPVGSSKTDSLKTQILSKKNVASDSAGNITIGRKTIPKKDFNQAISYMTSDTPFAQVPTDVQDAATLSTKP